MKKYIFPFMVLMALASCETDKELEVIEIPVKPYEINTLWMVGNATEAGCNIDSPVEMTKTGDNTFSYTGHLNEGEFKCPMETGNWGGAFIMPTYNGVTIDSNGVASDDITLMPTGNPDNKWNETQSGNYRIVIDGNTRKINVTFID